MVCIGYEQRLRGEVKKYVKSSLCFNKHQVTNTYGGVEVQIHAFLTSAFEGDEWSVLVPCGNKQKYSLNAKQVGPQRGSVLADE
jgi:hypothetical protein